MRYSHFRIINYKSFVDTGVFQLGTGINTITGKNNSGKTTLLESLALKMRYLPHRSEVTIPYKNAIVLNPVCAQMRIEVRGREWIPELMKMDKVAIPMPFDGDGTPFDRPLDSLDFNRDRQYFNEFWEWLSNHDSLPFDFELTIDSQNEFKWQPLSYPSFGLYWEFGAKHARNQNRHFWVWKRQGDVLQSYVLSKGTLGPNPELPDCGTCLIPLLEKSTYIFRAERNTTAISPLGTSKYPDENAKNLPEVITNFQWMGGRLNRFNDLVRAVLPNITWVSATPINESQLEIRVWEHDPRSEREDLAIPISECGTGVGQVLAMLAILVASEEPKVLIIDEPQTFLHPGAVRKLIDIIKANPVKHQYIFATHSSTVISSAGAERIGTVTKDGMISHVNFLDAKNQQAVHNCLTELGVNLSDVFGADRIIWVEGPTEEECFPLILSEILGVQMGGTSIVAVKSTGDLEGKDALRIYDIYNKLSSQASLLPPAIRYIFDSEGRSDKEKADLSRKSGKKAVFLPRRLYENYLLLPDAIAAIVNEIEGFVENEKSLDAGEIKAWIKDNEVKYEKGKKRSTSCKIHEGWPTRPVGNLWRWS